MVTQIVLSEMSKCPVGACTTCLITIRTELLASFVQTESQLERYLLENPPGEKNASKAQNELSGVQRKLQEILGSEPQVPIYLTF